MSLIGYEQIPRDFQQLVNTLKGEGFQAIKYFEGLNSVVISAINRGTRSPCLIEVYFEEVSTNNDGYRENFYTCRIYKDENYTHLVPTTIEHTIEKIIVSYIG